MKRINRYRVCVAFHAIFSLLAVTQWDDSFAAQWAKMYSDPVGSLIPLIQDIAPTPDGGFIAVGYITIDLENAWVFKVDAQGNIIWQYAIDYS